MLELLQHQALWVLTMHRNGAHDGPESVLTFARNHCSRSTGMGAHDAPEYARFPFDTRKQESEESYGGFNQLSWQNSNFISQMRARDLVRALTWSYRRLGI
jgi:hypothetical protein